MAAGPHLICSICETNVDTGSDSPPAPGEAPDDRKTWIVSCMGESRGLLHIADGLLAERNKILREGAELLERFTRLQDLVEIEDAKVVAFCEKYGVEGSHEEDHDFPIEGGVGNSGERLHQATV
ncbi:unnamed protein product [Rhizoctonia solani]|uniref:Uncharacterized protein n=1 Tax=Rhizoctonia solani TaxID=456999 RepID=A0A8H3ARJ5_9AGAM|nr:unnamed protein product [Rhizoctonia solani]